MNCKKWNYGITGIIFKLHTKEITYTSNTEAFIKKAEKIFHQLDVATEILRVVNYNVKFGNTADEGDGDEWPVILNKVKQSDIMI